METIATSVSENNIFPRGNNVLIKFCMKASILDLQMDKPGDHSKGESADAFISGYGPAVKDLNLGDKVLVELNQSYTAIEVAGNSRSVKVLHELYRTMKPSEFTELLRYPETAKVDVVQYGIFPEFLVKLVIK